MLCRLTCNNLCRTIWIQGENQPFSRSSTRIMLKYLVSHTIQHLCMVSVLRRHLFWENKLLGTSKRWPLLFSRAFLFNFISYNLSFAVGSQAIKLGTSVSWTVKSAWSQPCIFEASFLFSIKSLVSTYW